MNRSLAACCMLLIASMAGLSGCAGAAATNSSAANAWARQRGGTVCGEPLERVQRVSHPLFASLGRDAGSIRLHVLASDSLTGFAWPSGDIYLSRGLTEQLTDDELAAVVAHEMGHLVGDGHVSGLASLDGEGVASDHGPAYDHEQHADELGCQLLSRSGLPTSAMITMLQKVHNAQPADSALRPSLRHRIAALKTR